MLGLFVCDFTVRSIDSEDFSHYNKNRTNVRYGEIAVARVILHSDANAFYASVECLYNPELRKRPLAVGGDPESRHGIILAKNELAKKAGVKTAEAIWEAREKCPELIVLNPNYDRYLHFSNKLREIYADYTDRIEAFGLDENWLDLSESGMSIEHGYKTAEKIRIRAKKELGITVSIGVSFNKVFAKLASDIKKPDYTTPISEEDYQRIVWPRSVNELLYVGTATKRKFGEMGIITIGDLAMLSIDTVRSRLGKAGLMLKEFAMGLDQSTVMAGNADSAIKSIGNSTTTPHDIQNLEDAKYIFYLLAESVARRLREQGFRSRCLSIYARTTDLEVGGCQRVLDPASNLTSELAHMSMTLFQECLMSKLPLRSVGVCCSELIPEDAPAQLDLFRVGEKRERQLALEHAVDELRNRFGHQILRRGITLADKEFAKINPRAEAGPQGVAFVMGNRASSVLN